MSATGGSTLLLTIGFTYSKDFHLGLWLEIKILDDKPIDINNIWVNYF